MKAPALGLKIKANIGAIEKTKKNDIIMLASKRGVMTLRHHLQ
jgi:hypothetical protein